jgi:hypothetical protein
MGLLDMNQQGMPQGQMQGGLLGGGTQQPQGNIIQMPPEMIKIVDQIKIMPQDQKMQAIQQMAEHIQNMSKSDQEKQSAIQQFMSAVL